MDDDCGFVIFSGNRLWYSSKEGIENSICKTKPSKPNVNKVRNSAKNKKIIQHPIFEFIMKNETDPYWISFFDDASVGNLPRNFKFYNNTLIYRIKNRNVNLSVPEDPITAVILIKKFLIDNAGIMSPTDTKNIRIEEERKLAETSQNEINNWSQIRSDKQQTILISLFVEKLSEIYRLGFDERKSLGQMLKIGVLAGYLNNDNMELVDNQIYKIHGLEYDELNRQFSINKEICKSNKPIKRNYGSETTFDTEEENFSNNRKTLLKNWHRFLNETIKKSKV